MSTARATRTGAVHAFDDGILSAVGQTPLVALQRILPTMRFRLYAKIEGLNPGGSIKDRPALEILRRGRETGVITDHTVIIESSSGNMGIGLAQACAYYNLRLICVVDAKTTKENLALLQAYGAEIEVVREPNANGDYLEARLARVRTLLTLIPNSYWPNQYANRWNVLSHALHTMPEIAEHLDGRVDYLFCSTSTCGTITGCAEHIRSSGMSTRVIAVDAVGSAIFGGPKSRRLIPGHGAAITPALCDVSLIDACVHVSDIDCILGCRALLRREAILAGGSSGAVVAAISRMQPELPDNAVVVAIFPDRGERYLQTVYNDSWVREHFGDILVALPQWPQSAAPDWPR